MVKAAFEGRQKGDVVPGQPGAAGSGQLSFPVLQKIGLADGTEVIFTGQQGNRQRVPIGGMLDGARKPGMFIQAGLGLDAVLAKQFRAGGFAQPMQGCAIREQALVA